MGDLETFRIWYTDSDGTLERQTVFGIAAVQVYLKEIAKGERRLLRIENLDSNV